MRILFALGLLAGLTWVAPTNERPVLDPIGSFAANGTGLIELDLSAHDADGDRLVYLVHGLPHGATFDSATGKLRWYTGKHWWGKTAEVTFVVSDGAQYDLETVVLQLDRPGNVNEAPIIRGERAAAVIAGCDLDVPLSVVDPDRHQVRSSFRTRTGALGTADYHGLPPGARWAGGRLRWTPSEAQAGRDYYVTLVAHDRVVDNARYATHTMVVRVMRPRHAPLPGPAVPVTALVGRWKTIERADEVPTAARGIEFRADGTAVVELVAYDVGRDLASVVHNTFDYRVEGSRADPQVGTIELQDHARASSSPVYRNGDRLILEDFLGHGPLTLRPCRDPECLPTTPLAPCEAIR